MFEDIRNENLRLNAEIDKLKDKLSTLRKSPELIQVDVPSVCDEDVKPEVDVRIIRERCKHLMGQITTLNNRSLLTLPENEDIYYLTLRKDLETRKAEYRECLAFLNIQRKDILEDIQSEERTMEELRAVISAAEIKLQETINEKHSKTEVIKSLEVKCKALDTANSKIWKDMSAFLDENYPLPDQETFNKVKKKLNGSEDTRLMNFEDLKPLKEIVKELMTACIDTPNEPYIVTDNSYWPPYVDLLTHVDIALRHPSDSRRIKLMPFHL